MDFLTDELLMVRHSGEIPEVALHSSLYFLGRDPEGPGLKLDSRQIRALQAMVIERYREIIRRDLEPDNRDLGLYRGLARARVNWRRLLGFCRREGWASEVCRAETAALLLAFLGNEAAEVYSGARTSAVNCDPEELGDFARELGLAPADLPSGWAGLCKADG